MYTQATLLAALVFAGASLASQHAISEIYKWVDENGVTHYSDSRHSAPEHHQQVDDSLPVVQRMEKPDPKLSAIQRQAEHERKSSLKKSAPTRVSRRASSNACSKWENQLRKVQAQLRRGYKEPRGNKLRDKRRQIQADINTHCR